VGAGRSGLEASLFGGVLPLFRPRQFQDEGTLAMAVATRIEPLLMRVAYAFDEIGVDSRA
jgi:hypothetical protein